MGIDRQELPELEYAGLGWERYRRLVERIEALEQNQSGADKTWVERTVRVSLEHFRKARRVR